MWACVITLRGASLWQEAVRATRQTFGATHPHTLVSVNALAMLYNNMQSFSEVRGCSASMH